MLCPFLTKGLSEGRHCQTDQCQLWVEAEATGLEGNCAFQWLARTAIDKTYFFDKEDKENKKQKPVMYTDAATKVV